MYAYLFTSCDSLHTVSKFAKTTCFNPLITGGFIQTCLLPWATSLFEVIKPLTFCNEFTFNGAFWGPLKWHTVPDTQWTSLIF